jgi:MoaA/NifB/PqqE/SkfB family radical SAM enzyme
MYIPTNIYYMNTIECNQKCTKCSHWKYKDKADRLPTEKLINGIKSIPTVTELCIVGGEPLMFKNEIYEILQGIADTDIRTVIITNGVSMDKEFIHTVSKYNSHIVVSIDTMDKEFWKFVRGTNSKDKVLKNFEFATTILTPTQISIQSVLSKETQPHIAEVAEYANSKNIYHSIQDYISEGFEGSWTATENKQAVIPDNGQQCFAADRNLSIVQNGDVYTCFQQTWIDSCQKPLGNLNTQTMNEILSTSYAVSVSEKMRICNLPCKVLKCNTKN